jgi:hypothetical protein
MGAPAAAQRLPPRVPCALPRAVPLAPGCDARGSRAFAGAYLSEPITEKETTSGEDSRLRYGVASMQGWRTSMEDAHAVRARAGCRGARKRPAAGGVLTRRRAFFFFRAGAA